MVDGKYKRKCGPSNKLGKATLLSPNKDETAAVVPTAWIAAWMETGHHGNQSGQESH